ncbi:MAG TPA: cytochrome c oxidase assembly protein [Puia sp.]|jgi:cytochrome c oxidase assembly factor CtaG|nr:cytochrome c oxidase assembly protein [Puia sp.]
MKKHTYLRLIFLAAALISMALAQYSFFSGGKFIFTSHMFGHVILLLIAAPFFVLAMRERPEAMGGLAFGLSRWLSAMPWLNWILGIGILWAWQVPSILNALMTWDSPGFHRHLHLLSFLHSGSLLLAGILFCWPFAGPYQSHRISAPESLFYLTTGWVAITLLASLIEFATPGLYGGPAIPVSHRDQLLAGLVLWIPACLVCFGAGIYLLREWMGGELWIHHEFYRRNKRRHVRTAHDQEQIPAGPGEFVPRGGAIISHHSPQQI